MKNVKLILSIFLLLCHHLNSSGKGKEEAIKLLQYHQPKVADPLRLELQEKPSSVFSKTTKITGRLIASSRYNPKTPGGTSLFIDDTTRNIFLSPTRGGDLTSALKSDTSYITNYYFNENYRVISEYDGVDSFSYGFVQLYNDTTDVWENINNARYHYDAAANIDTVWLQDWDKTLSVWANTDLYYYAYDSKKNILESVWQNWLPATSLWDKVKRETFTYDAKDRLLTRIEDMSDGSGGWRPVTKDNYSYDSKDDLFYFLEQSMMSGVWTNRLAFEYTYDLRHNRLTAAEKNWLILGSGSYWQYNERFTYTYNAANYRLSEIKEKYEFGVWKNIWKYLYSRDAKNNMLQSLKQEWLSGWQDDERRVMTYDAASNRLSDLEQVYDPPLNKWYDMDRWLYTWNSYNQMTSEDHHTWDWTYKKWEYNYGYGISYYYYEDYDAPAMKPVVAFKSNATVGLVPTTFTFTDESTNDPDIWKWSFSPDKVSFSSGTGYSSQNPVLSFTDTGWYTVKLMVSNAAGADSVEKVSFIRINPDPSTSSIENTNIKKEVYLYPNPAKNSVNIFTSSAIKAIAARSLSGQLVNINYSTIHANQTSVNTSGLPSGVYFMNIITEDDKTIIRKLIIEK